MSIRTRFIAGFAVCAALAMPVAAQDVSADTVVATVNGTDITVGTMIVMRDSLPDKYKSLPDDVLFDAVLNQAIQQTVLAQSVKDTSREIQLRLANEKRSLLAGKAIDRIVRDAVTDEALQAAYEKKYANAAPETELNASHILVATEEEAKAIEKELADGADFAELAKAKSTGPSGPSGGELGWFTRGMMVKPFEDAVFALKEGEVSPPVKTQFGWHVIKLNGKRLKDAPKLDDVRDELAAEIQRSALEKKLSELTDAADIKRPDISGISPGVLRDLSLLAD